MAEANLYDLPSTLFNDLSKPVVKLLSKYVIKSFRIMLNSPARFRRKTVRLAEDFSCLVQDAEYIDEKSMPSVARSNVRKALCILGGRGGLMRD